MSDLRRGIYILPNLFTTASLFCGFYAIVIAVERVVVGALNYQKCAIAIIFAAMFDGLDGRVARRTKTATRFGVEYDSLSDLVSFGVAPALVLYSWALRGFERGWLPAFLYMACGALRLARFNVQATGVEKKYFQGLPIPMAALMVAGSILIWEGRPVDTVELFIPGEYFLLAMTFLLSLLMVSTIPYRSFKTIDLATRHPFYNLVMMVIAVVVWATKPWWILFFIGCTYVLSGPVERYILPRPIQAYRQVRRRRRIQKTLDRMDEIASSDNPTIEANVHPIRKP